MDYAERLNRKLVVITSVVLFSTILISGAFWVGADKIFPDDTVLKVLSWAFATIALTAGAASLTIRIALKPLKMLSDIIVYVGHSARGGIAPIPENLKNGREMICSLAAQVYDLASMTKQSSTLSTADAATGIPEESPGHAPHVIEQLDLPIIGIDARQNVTMLNKAAAVYLGLPADSVLGKPLYDSLKLSFRSGETFEIWFKDRQQNTVHSSKQWERVRLTNAEGEVSKQFDLVASYTKGSSSDNEALLALFDRTEQYARDDQETAFVALAVHELRTPLTVMRGYIEVFEDEVGPTLSPELTGFMHKMQASAQQLTAFVGNILNVARVEENQLVLSLQEYSWQEIVKVAVEDLSLRAGVYGIHIETNIAPNLPTVAVDRISVHEVINNLVDNAIKYSNKSDHIVITSVLNSEGFVETSVQDFGIGIPAAVIPDLFQKYYRSHKSRVQISGTGLGLYLCRAIVGAHGGNIWVRSKEGEGSIFSFTLQVFDKVKHEQVDGQDGIMRGAHGWIKNHTLNRQ
jgi:two-component system phosphate regulon sensor histidine kinase PhoR/two-component system sensor histidine kinase VicK